MHEREKERQPHEEHPGVYEAAQEHWNALADPVGMRDEFGSNYLGCWPNERGFVNDLARDAGFPVDAQANVANQLARTKELAFIADDYGLHVFVHPVGPETRQAQAVARLRHLRLVPRVENDAVADGAHPARPHRV